MGTMSEATKIQASPEQTEANGTFAEFFAEGYSRLVRAVLPATRDLGVAEEVAQEAMTRVFARWGRVSRLDSPIGYAYVAAINVHRRRSKRPWRPLTRDIADPSPDPAWQVASRDRLLVALAALSQGERDALLLVSFLGLSSEEAGRALKIKPASVRSRLHRARTSLQELEERKDE
jgi:RNA polymerase sigma factor (sigma-70 family)